MAVPVADVIHNKEIRRGGGGTDRGGPSLQSQDTQAYLSLALYLTQFPYKAFRHSHLKQGITLLGAILRTHEIKF